MSETLQTALILLLAAERLVCLVRWIADAPRRDMAAADARAREILREADRERVAHLRAHFRASAENRSGTSTAEVLGRGLE
jgi:hypothetical protein